jgi:aspartate/methionine/tyrosine aminotransferase
LETWRPCFGDCDNGGEAVRGVEVGDTISHPAALPPCAARDAVNLAKGFPDFPAPAHVKAAATAAITADLN